MRFPAMLLTIEPERQANQATSKNQNINFAVNITQTQYVLIYQFKYSTYFKASQRRHILYWFVIYVSGKAVIPYDNIQQNSCFSRRLYAADVQLSGAIISPSEVCKYDSDFPSREWVLTARRFVPLYTWQDCKLLFADSPSFNSADSIVLVKYTHAILTVESGCVERVFAIIDIIMGFTSLFMLHILYSNLLWSGIKVNCLIRNHGL